MKYHHTALRINEAMFPPKRFKPVMLQKSKCNETMLKTKINIIKQCFKLIKLHQTTFKPPSNHRSL